MNKNEAEAVIRDTIEYANHEIKKVRIKYRNLSLIIISALILIGLFIYFRPLAFTDIVSKDHRIELVLNEMGVRDGEPYVDSAVYQDITEEQKSEIRSVLEKYKYRRTPGTLFSGGSVSGDRLLSVYVYDDVLLTGSVLVSSSGEVSVNAGIYHMKNAEQLIEEIIEIIQKEE